MKKTSPRLLAAALLGAACAFAHAQDDAQAYAQWRAANPVRQFEAYLAESGLNGMVPTRQLARTATDWRKCGGPQFELPPREQWPHVKQVLLLIAELKKRKILGEFEAVSSYRNPELNACARGAARSSHARSFAVDIMVVRDVKSNEKLLCDFWRKEGQAWQMGLSKYPSGRIHLDTSHYRSWGADHTKASSFCAMVGSP